MLDQLGFFGVIAAILGNPFGIRDAAAAGMTAAAQGLLNGAITLDEYFGRFIGPRLAKVMMFQALLLGALLFGSDAAHHKVAEYNAKFTIHGAVVVLTLIGTGAVVAFALYQRFAAANRPRSVSLASATCFMVGVPAVLMVAEFIDAGLTGSGWHFLVAMGFFLITVLTLAFMVGVASWIFKKTIEVLETGLTLVGEPIATVLPGTTTENVKERTEKLFDLVREEYWAQKLNNLAPATAASLIPYYALASWWINAEFFVWLAVSYFTMIALAWVAIYRFLDEEILKGQQTFIRWMMALFIPVRAFLQFAGNPNTWRDKPLIGVSDWGLIIAVGIVALFVLSGLLKGIGKSGITHKLLAAVAALTLGWAVMSFYIKAKGYDGWSPGYGFRGTPTESSSKKLAKSDSDASAATPAVTGQIEVAVPVEASPPPPVVVNVPPRTVTTPAPRQASKRHSSHRAPKPMTTQEAEDAVNQMIKARGLTIPED